MTGAALDIPLLPTLARERHVEPLRPAAAQPAPISARPTPAVELSRTAYEDHFTSVWRTLRRLGVPERRLDDAVQDVFMVVHRRAAEFRGDSQLRTWVLGIAVRVAANARRGDKKERQRFAELNADLQGNSRSPDELAAQRQAVQLLHSVLESLKPEHRDLFVLVELEQLSVAEAAEVLNVNASTCYKRLSAARDCFNAQVERAKTRHRWRSK